MADVYDEKKILRRQMGCKRIICELLNVLIQMNCDQEYVSNVRADK